MRVLITGNKGFIGSHLEQKLLSNGFTVDGFDIKNNLQEDINNAESVMSKVEGVDAVIHLAAFISHKYSWLHPDETIKNNLIGTLNVLEACRKCDTERVVVASSCEVYGNFQEKIYGYSQPIRLKEDSPLAPESPYAGTKMGVDALCMSYYHTYKLPVVLVRQFNVFGKNQDCSEFGAVIPIFLDNIKQGKPLMIYGDGDQVRDFLYVDDIVDFYELTMLKNAGYYGKPINVGSGECHSINEIAHKILLWSGEMNYNVIHVPTRRCDLKYSLCDNSLAKKLFGWEPKWSFDDALREVIRNG